MIRLVPAVAAAMAFASWSPVFAEEIERGRDLYKECEACHGLEPDERRVGPSLYRIFGRTAGENPNFGRYSEAMQESDIVWDEETLSAYIADPEGIIPGTRKAFSGMGSAEDRDALIAYLREEAQ